MGLVLEIWYARVTRRVISDLECRGRTDALTGLGNRWAFDDDLDSRLRSSSATIRRRRSDPESTALLLADIDYFKRYNDRYGHPAGDEALVRVAGAMQRACRGGDGIHPIGGEEFAVILSADHGEILVIADRIRRAVVQDTGGELSVSLGVATARADTVDTLVARADGALYEAKNRGRNCISSQVHGPWTSSPAVGLWSAGRM
jgi:diguanylate cyclase (GGDEF)-like protein